MYDSPVAPHAKRLQLNELSTVLMAQSADRLGRYLEDELGSCCDEDVQDRLAELESLGGGLQGLDVLSALANETRYRLVRALVAADGELCVCELNHLSDVSESGLSHALSKLTDAGLVASRTEGRWKHYRATTRAVALVTVLDGTIDE